MMRKECLWSPLLLASLFTQGFWDSEAPCCDKSSKSPSFRSKAEPVLEVKVGYFFFASSKMRKIYDNGGLDLQLSGSFPIWKWLQGYLSVEYLQKSGRSLGDHQETSIWEIPVSLGLKPVFKISKRVQYYFALGPRYFYIHQHNNSAFVNKNIGRNGVGGFLNTGFNFFPRKHMTIDIFGEYSYEQVSIHNFNSTNVYGETTQVGGLSFGLGLGYSF